VEREGIDDADEALVHELPGDFEIPVKCSRATSLRIGCSIWTTQ
jgi:hypothetical protein